ncbi:MAG TPA: hypothetical protein H9754_03375 [Candidatus Anaerostipes avistercoris]|uniref:Acyl-CoA reductase (LuxC) n=1 Tax=Candidatus Anaerostipes avistercoris TaxID=2838462 RepID=A0A9D2PHA0_9FIRM|nr:acyl-CoA reductase [uncultured Anaerostipes sp.]HJC49613.1 hypothetical protein [Candidatus Anaerostipes avistercoris]
MFMDDRRIKKFAGGWHGQRVNASVPFSNEAVHFLGDLSEEIRKDPETAATEDFSAFGFWCRKKQLEAWKKEYMDRNQRLGWGLILHIAPSNIPALSAYSMVFGLLPGNGNLIRVSRRTKEETAPLYRVIEQVMSRPEHKKLYEENLIFTCGHEEEERNQLAVRFYNDTYHMDQNACSSPKMLFWLGDDEAGIEAWWKAVRTAAEKYHLDAWKVSRKYEEICFAAMEKEEIRSEIIRTGARGGDRIVPAGQALTMGLVWDGKDMIRNLSRRIIV